MSIPIRAEKPSIREAEGVLRIGRTGVTLETVIWAFLEGTTPEDIADQFPTVTLAEVYDVIAYYLRHREDVDDYLRGRASLYQQTTTKLEQTMPDTRLRRHLRERFTR